MAIASLRYNQDNEVDETRQGIFIYDGDATRFHEWEFRTTMKMTSVKAEDAAKTINSIVEALRGEAAVVAMDVGVTTLLADGGWKKLVEAVRVHTFTNVRTEAKELYRIGHQRKGILSRQPGEPMISFVSRRRRWWDKLKKLDGSIELSTAIRGDLMLDASTLTKDQQNMVLTSIANSREFDKIAEGLIEQHGDIHKDESKKPQKNDRSPRAHAGRASVHSKGSKGKGSHFGSKKQGFQKKWHRQAHLADEDEYYEDDYEEQPEPEESEYDDDDEDDEEGDQGHGYVAQDDVEPDGLVETQEEAVIDAYTCLICQGLTDGDQIAYICQAESNAFAAWNKGSKGKGGGKGFGKRGKYSKGMKPRLSLEGRKKALSDLKRRTKCIDCDEIGHWAGDAECKKKGLKIRKKRFANVATDLDDSEEIHVHTGGCCRGALSDHSEVILAQPGHVARVVRQIESMSFSTTLFAEENAPEVNSVPVLQDVPTVPVLQDAPSSESEISSSAPPDAEETVRAWLARPEDHDSDDSDFVRVAPRLGYPAKVREVEDEETPFPAPEDRRMSYGVYKGKMFTEIARDHPEYEELLEAAYKNKSENSVPQYVKQYLAWLTDHKKTKQLPAKTRT